MKVAIRADASSEIGAGHLVRCLALADVLAAGGSKVAFVCRSLPAALAQLVVSSGHDLIPLRGDKNRWEDDAHETAVILARQGPCDWVIVDHYGLDARWEVSLRAVARRVLAIDDLPNRPHDCDVLLDQNDDGRIGMLVPSEAKVLRGPSFALVRTEFAAVRASAMARRTGELRRILVFMGGSDPRNETSKVLMGLERLGRTTFAVDVVIGADNPRQDEVERLCSRLPGATLHVQTRRMPDLTLAADLAFGAGGGATWERCVLGLPALVTVMADNQRAIAAGVAAAGAQRVLGWWRELTPADYADAISTLDRSALLDMSARAGALCDGRGAERVANLLLTAQTRECLYG